MIPFDLIEIGDEFSNPTQRNFGNYSGLVFEVVNKDDKEKMIEVQAKNFISNKNFKEPFWKKNTDRMFSESWREYKYREKLNE